MLRQIILFSTILLGYVFYGFYISSFKFSVTDKKINSLTDITYYDYKGVTHAHSDISIGSKSQEKIIEEAKEARLNFLIFSEKNIFEESNRFEGYNDNLIVLQAEKYSYLNSEIIYYGEKLKNISSLGSAQVALTDLLTNQDNLGPDSFVVLSRYNSEDEAWVNKLATGIGAVEVINLKNSFSAALKSRYLRFITSLFQYPFNSKYALVRLFDYPGQGIEFWTKLNQQNKTIGFMGNATTAKAILFKGSDLQFPKYQTSFELASNHILMRSELTGNFIKDRSKLLSSLKKGNFYFAIDALTDPIGFFADVSSNKKKYLPGESVQLSSDTSLRVYLPDHVVQPTEIIVFRNNEVYTKTSSSVIEFPLHQEGFYRVEVRLQVNFPFPEGEKWMPWIFTNGFYVKSISKPDRAGI